MGCNIEIAETILPQLGGSGRLKAMIGAKNFCAVESGVSFRFPRSNGINYVKITLNGKDLYDVEYGYLSVKAYKVRSRSEDLYNDMLKNDIEQNTKLYLSL